MITWTSVGGPVMGYKVQRKPYYRFVDSSWVDSYTTVYNGTTTAYFDPVTATADPTGQTFTYRVCAYNSAGDGAYSAEGTIIW